MKISQSDFIKFSTVILLPNILKTSEPRPKQNRRPEPWKHTHILLVQFFRHTRLSSKIFQILQRVTLQFFDILQQEGTSEAFSEH